MFDKKELVEYIEDLYMEASNVSSHYSDGDNELKKNKIISIIREYYKEEKQIDVELLDKISFKSFHEKKDYWLENYGDSKAIVCSLDKKDYWLEPREGTTKNYKFAYAQKISAWSYLIEHNEYHTRNLVFILINEPEAKEHLKNNEYKPKKLGTIGAPNVDYAKLKKDILDPFEIATNSARERLTLKGATDTYYHENDNKTKIARLFNNFREFLIEKNIRCGDSALKPNQIFCKESGSKQIMSRLDNKLSRIANSEELKKNDLSDVFGYVALLLIANGWLTFYEFLD